MLEVRELTVDYPRFRLGPVSFDLDAGEFVSLIGPNGSGKSTLIKAILGLSPLANGYATLHDELVSPRRRETLSRIGYLTDNADDVLQEFTATEYWHYCRLAHETSGRRPLPDALDRATEIATRLGLPVTRVPLRAMSLGTRRKAQIAAVLMTAPDLLILDEPFIGLDFISARALEDLLWDEVYVRGAGVLCSSHDLTLAARISHKAVVLYNGELIISDRLTDVGGVEGLEHRILEAVAGRSGR